MDAQDQPWSVMSRFPIRWRNPECGPGYRAGMPGNCRQFSVETQSARALWGSETRVALLHGPRPTSDPLAAVVGNTPPHWQLPPELPMDLCFPARGACFGACSARLWAASRAGNGKPQGQTSTHVGHGWWINTPASHLGWDHSEVCSTQPLRVPRGMEPQLLTVLIYSVIYHVLGFIIPILPHFPHFLLYVAKSLS